jgi:hypothetical protein
MRHRLDLRFTWIPLVGMLGLVVTPLAYGPQIAIAADRAGAYEIGERIYSLANRSGDQSLATICGRSAHDNNLAELKCDRLNTTVATIYGPESRQMANRFLILGFHYQQNFNDYRNSEVCFRRAISIYRLHHDDAKCAQALSFLAYAQIADGDKRGAEDSVRQARNLMPSSANDQLSRITVNELDAATWLIIHSV